MSMKPDDVPQRIWDIAHGININELWAVIPDDSDDIKLYQDTTRIARAIMAAVEEEREACAEIAEGEKMTGTPPDWIDPVQVSLVEASVATAALSIAREIRNRSNSD